MTLIDILKKGIDPRRDMEGLRFPVQNPEQEPNVRYESARDLLIDFFGPFPKHIARGGMYGASFGMILSTMDDPLISVYALGVIGMGVDLKQYGVRACRIIKKNLSEQLSVQ